MIVTSSPQIINTCEDKKNSTPLVINHMYVLENSLNCTFEFEIKMILVCLKNLKE